MGCAELFQPWVRKRHIGGNRKRNKENKMSDDSKPENPAPKNPARDRPGPLMEANLRTHRSAARLGRDAQVKIGQQLRAIYADVVDQGVPDRFVELIHRLDEAKLKKGGE
jgi:hypothetical protein